MSSQEPESVSEISLPDIVNFVQESWKKLAIAALVGGILGFANWNFLGSYQAEYVLLNNSNTYGLDLLSWKVIQKSLPNLAAQIVEDRKVQEGQVGSYRALASDQWWQKNAIPVYAFSKTDSKDLAGISKEFDDASTTILSVVINASGSSQEAAMNAAKGAAQFLRSGGAYLQLRSMLISYEGEVIMAAGEIQKKITGTKIEMGYQQQRAKSLEELYKRYPSNSSFGQQVVDPKESGTKYLSITTQIIAANNDINQSKEVIIRLNDRLAQLALIKVFLDEALPASQNTYDGLELNKELLAIEAKLRDKIGKDDPRQQDILDQIHSQLLIIQARFTKGLESNSAPTSSGKKGMIKSIGSGLAGGFSLALLLLLGQRMLHNVKSSMLS